MTLLSCKNVPKNAVLDALKLAESCLFCSISQQWNEGLTMAVRLPKLLCADEFLYANKRSYHDSLDWVFSEICTFEQKFLFTPTDSSHDVCCASLCVPCQRILTRSSGRQERPATGKMLAPPAILGRSLTPQRLSAPLMPPMDPNSKPKK